MSKITEITSYAAFTMALVATAASLSLSEILGFTPCVLCWYQRILMYPLVVIIGVAVFRKDNFWPYTALPLAGLGWAIALYHSLLQWGVISERLAPCVNGVSCAVREGAWFGFVTIPFLSFVAFSVIIVLSLLQMRGVKNDQRS